MSRPWQLLGGIAMTLAAIPCGAQHNASIAGAGPTAAQAVRAVQFIPGLLLGGVLPTSELADFYNTGIRAGATLAAVVPARPYGVRLAVTYDRLSGGTVALPGQTVREIESGSVVSVTLAGLVSERAERTALLYFTAGAGVHRLDIESAESSGSDDEPTDEPDEVSDTGGAETKFGASVGGGITFRLGRFPSYLEVQVVKLFGADAVLVPVVVGVQLGR
ncbi:MAG TPA: hypothetical protein VK922_04375 [Gemmatimonadaceae bacterium]|nr:hypothetical protein [Gemmatimonadaceae bacterium]